MSVSYKSAYELIMEYAAFNPHAHFSYPEPHDDFAQVLRRTTDDWRKWTPRDPTSAHWYTDERLRGLIAAYVADERRGGRARTVREFVGEFAGLRGTAKQGVVTEAAGLGRAYLHDLVAHEDVALDAVRPLLVAMQASSRPVKPAALGVLGEAHIRRHLIREWTDPESIKYRKVDGFLDDGLPVVLDLAFGWRTEECPMEGRRIIAGINWTPSIKFPFLELPSWLGEQRVDADDPVMFFAHLAMPRPDFTDRGKSFLSLPSEILGEMAKGVITITKHWKTMKRQTDRKEGFDALLDAAQIANRYDVAIFSTKGQSVTAARALIEALSLKGVTILVVHDFDKSGIEILHTLYSHTRRYTYRTMPKVIDLGFRLSDVQGLERERVEYKGAKKSPAINLRTCGATEAECAFLVRREGGQWVGDRVELNAMRSDQLIAWLEGKFAEVGVEKVVPDADTLARAYRLALRKSKLQAAIDDALTSGH